MEACSQNMNELFKSDQTFNESHLIKVVYNCLYGLAILHESNIIHRDLNPNNIFIDAQCNVKIANFEHSRTVAS